MWLPTLFTQNVKRMGHGNSVEDAARPTPPSGIGLLAAAGCAPYSSRISTAAAIVVVHSPRLSPIADCVTLLVRTILLEMR